MLIEGNNTILTKVKNKRPLLNIQNNPLPQFTISFRRKFFCVFFFCFLYFKKNFFFKRKWAVIIIKKGYNIEDGLLDQLSDGGKNKKNKKSFHVFFSLGLTHSCCFRREMR